MKEYKKPWVIASTGPWVQWLLADLNKMLVSFHSAPLRRQVLAKPCETYPDLYSIYTPNAYII